MGALIRAVPAGAAGPDWAHAPSYIRRHMAAHAAAAGLLDDLLKDPLYLLTADPARLVPYLTPPDPPRPGPPPPCTGKVPTSSPASTGQCELASSS